MQASLIVLVLKFLVQLSMLVIHSCQAVLYLTLIHDIETYISLSSNQVPAFG